MATLGELYSFSEEYIENSVIKVVQDGTTTPISGVQLTVTFTGYGETSVTSTTDSDGLSEFFLLDFDSNPNFSVQVTGSPTVYNFTHQDGDLELFTLELIVTKSEILNASVDQKCANQEYYLTWINSVGGYEFWKFTAEATKGFNSINKEVFNKDVFQDWDNEFINGVRDKKVLQNKWEETLLLRTQLLTEDQAKALSKIKLSNAVFLIDGTKEIPVQVDTASLQYFTDRDRVITLEFNIKLPEIYGQTS